MGVDVTFAVRTAERMTDEEFARVQADFYAAFPDTETPHQFPSFERDDEEPNAVEIQSLDRYYGPAYSRGFWPQIRAMGDWLVLRFGEAAGVRYGGDYSRGWNELPDYLPQRAENEEHWNTLGHAPYRDACNCDHCMSLSGRSDVRSGDIEANRTTPHSDSELSK